MRYLFLTHLSAAVILGGLLFGTTAAAAPQQSGKSAAKPAPFSANWQPTDFSWTEGKWTDSDAPYLAVKQELLGKIQSGTSARQIAESLEPKLSAASPALDRFRYAYAVAYARGMKQWPEAEAQKKGKYAVYLLAAKPFPRAYEYIRLRFFLEVHALPNAKLIPLGKRLLAAKPNDASIQGRYVNLLTFSPRTEDRREAVRVADELLRKNPNVPDNHARLGGAYWGLWQQTRKREDGQKAIAAYQSYLKVAPPTEPFRAEAQRIITTIQDGMTKTAKAR
jgi:tetratricopeptide (TPR) repeat protein